MAGDRQVSSDLTPMFCVCLDSAIDLHSLLPSFACSICLGYSGVGKSSLLKRYVDNSFSAAAYTTIGMEFMSRLVQHRGETVKVRPPTHDVGCQT